MNTEQQTQVLKKLEEMIDANARMLKAMSTLAPDQQIEFFQSVMGSINNSAIAIKNLTDESINQLRTIPA